MHTQTEKTSSSRLPGTAPPLHGATGLGLYLLTLSVEVLLGAGFRWLLIFLAATTTEPLIPLGLGAETLAWIGALAPLAHSLLALVLPGRGRIWSRRLGARRPSAEERAAVDDALSLLEEANPGSHPKPTVYVLDNPLPVAAVRGRALLISHSLIDSDTLVPVLAHELGHLNSLDGRLTEALQRLAIWPESPSPAQGGHHRKDGVEVDHGAPGALLWACLRGTLRIGAGGVGQRVLQPLWAAYWRYREFAADAHAASLGQAEDLAQHLTDYELPFEGPRHRLLFDRTEHPSVALRIERLFESAMAVSK